MIDPTHADLGRQVIYRNGPFTESGEVTGFNSGYVLVRYSSDGFAKATLRQHLDWADSTPTPTAAILVDLEQLHHGLVGKLAYLRHLRTLPDFPLDTLRFDEILLDLDNEVLSLGKLLEVIPAPAVSEDSYPL